MKHFTQILVASSALQRWQLGLSNTFYSPWTGAAKPQRRAQLPIRARLVLKSLQKCVIRLSQEAGAVAVPANTQLSNSKCKTHIKQRKINCANQEEDGGGKGEGGGREKEKRKRKDFLKEREGGREWEEREQRGGKEALRLASAHFSGVNTPALADF